MIYKIFEALATIFGGLAIILSVWLLSILEITNYGIDIAGWMPLSVVVLLVASFMSHCVAGLIFEVKINKKK